MGRIARIVPRRSVGFIARSAQMRRDCASQPRWADRTGICATRPPRSLWEQGKRYATARELAEDCTRALAGEAIRARPEAWWERPVRWPKRRKLVMGVGSRPTTKRRRPTSQRAVLDGARRSARNLQAGAQPRPAPAWLAALTAGDQAVQSGDNAAAGQAYTNALAVAQTAVDALPDADRTRLLADPAVRQALLNAHYNLACVLSLRIAGKAAPVAPIAPAAATPPARPGIRAPAAGHRPRLVRPRSPRGRRGLRSAPRRSALGGAAGARSARPE